jgi:ABC-type glycerol-3-phosphate transport system permease component
MKKMQSHSEKIRSTRRNTKRRFQQFSIISILSFLAFVAIFPYMIMVLTSLKNNQQVVDNYWGLPIPAHFENYKSAWNQTKGYFITTFTIVVAVVASVIFLGLMTGFIFARYKFFGRNFLFTMIGVLLMVPSIASLIPLFVLSKNLHLLNTIWVLIVPYIPANAILAVILFKNFMEAMPQELFDAAVVSGANGRQIFRYIAVPLSVPVVGSVLILTMLNVWNDYFWPLLTISNNSLRTISIGISFFQGQNATDYGSLMAGYTLASLPLILCFIFVSKYFLAGISGGLSATDK